MTGKRKNIAGTMKNVLDLLSFHYSMDENGKIEYMVSMSPMDCCLCTGVPDADQGYSLRAVFPLHLTDNTDKKLRDELLKTCIRLSDSLVCGTFCLDGKDIVCKWYFPMAVRMPDPATVRLILTLGSSAFERRWRCFTDILIRHIGETPDTAAVQADNKDADSDA